MSDDSVLALNENPGGFNRVMGLRFVSASADEVVGEWEVGEQHLQPYGIVHGGVYSAVIETLCSVGAALVARPRGQGVVGLENHTTFIKAARAGRLRASARPVLKGRRTQVWHAEVINDEGQTLATGSVRLLCLESEAQLAGQTLSVRNSGER